VDLPIKNGDFRMKHLLIDYGTLAFAFARPLPLVFDFASQGVMTTQR